MMWSICTLAVMFQHNKIKVNYLMFVFTSCIPVIIAVRQRRLCARLITLLSILSFRLGAPCGIIVCCLYLLFLLLYTLEFYTLNDYLRQILRFSVFPILKGLPRSANWMLIDCINSRLENSHSNFPLLYSFWEETVHQLQQSLKPGSCANKEIGRDQKCRDS